jgi:hypothetical protein
MLFPLGERPRLAGETVDARTVKQTPRLRSSRTGRKFSAPPVDVEARSVADLFPTEGEQLVVEPTLDRFRIVRCCEPPFGIGAWRSLIESVPDALI